MSEEDIKRLAETMIHMPGNITREGVQQCGQIILDLLMVIKEMRAKDNPETGA